jgi:hypothetical protein
MGRLVLLAVLAIVVTTGGVSSAVVLCARPRADGTFNTTVKIRQACAPRETQLDPGVLGLQGPPGQQGPSGQPGPPGASAPSFVVKDAIGQTVGTMVSPMGANNFWDQVSLVRSLGGVEVGFSVGGILNDGTLSRLNASYIPSSVVFASTACSGSPLLGTDGSFYNGNPPPQGSPAISAVFGDTAGARVAYYAIGSFTYTGPGSGIQIGSQLLGRDPDPAHCALNGGQFIPPDTCCNDAPPRTPPLVAPAAQFDLTALSLVPPFHIEGP